MRWYRRLVFQVVAWSKAMRGPEESPEVFAIGVMVTLLGLNVVALFFIYCRISGRDVAWVTRAASVFFVVTFPCAIAYTRYFLKRLPQLQAEFENPEEPSIGGPGMAFAVYAFVSIALALVALAI